ncbi:Kae1-associated serine/threonine protein kinase [Candidatus Bathyarchaeota archaeon]|nr:Kae1-associated serine/threonine protein kinase [Candidatus Bathyarchaeota archaeon]
MEELTLIAKGAEADILLDPDWNGVKAIIKRRGEKRYRIPELDAAIRRSRTVREASIIHRAKEAGVPTPLIYGVDPDGARDVKEKIQVG